MAERPKNLSEVFLSANIKDSIYRLGLSAGAFAAVEYVSFRTNGSFREMFALGLVFGIPTFLRFIEYANFDPLEEPRQMPTVRGFLRSLEDNIFESPRRS